MVSNGPSSTDRFEVQRNALIQEETEKVDREIGGRFRQWRQDAGLSQQDVSEMLGKVGLPLHQTNIAKMESGKRPIRLAEAVAVCRVFNMDPIVMFLADEDSPAQASDLDRITRMVDKQRKLVRQLGGSLADLLARRVIPYGRVYPFLELGAGALMLTGLAPWLSIPVALFIGGIGAVSVFKAVYIDKRELKCACVGGDSNVPLGFVSLTENVMMVAMALWMLVASH